MLNKIRKTLVRDPLATTERFCAVSQILSVLESFPSAERKKGGINDWEYTKFLYGTDDVFTDPDKRERHVRLLLGTRLASALTLLLPTSNNTRMVASALSGLTYAAGNKYTINGSDGAEQYAAIILTSSALGRTNGGKNKDLAIAFIAAQTTLSYFVAGIVKSLGYEWKRGTAVERVIRTESYGNEPFYKFLRAHPTLSTLLTRSTVIIETAFPALILCKKTRPLAFISMFAFHAANIELMGLGRFFLVFTSTYPAVARAIRPLV
ncbi:HTTM domain-containing protein [Corynebacterium sp.]|uniref:HTTM domain-containing protein n=1 Tax=Corynebacterium sp. TaxID=1720 RepID=UPI0026DA7FD8|nr:HTTM domain-containing protein [Corynebacterium sp.]MDO4610602.1 HTTM domain-containing protein [Corynebacterium sp.]